MPDLTVLDARPTRSCHSEWSEESQTSVQASRLRKSYL